jgi:hypothetical protein
MRVDCTSWSSSTASKALRTLSGIRSRTAAYSHLSLDGPEARSRRNASGSSDIPTQAIGGFAGWLLRGVEDAEAEPPVAQQLASDGDGRAHDVLQHGRRVLLEGGVDVAVGTSGERL